MSFCPNCGVRNEKSVEICTNCGGNLLMTNQHPVSDFPRTPNQNFGMTENDLAEQAMAPPDDFSATPQDATEYVRCSRIDSQLGKGTITPNAVERGIDGYHFKYDEPLRSITKAEPAKEKKVEFRVTEPEMSPANEPPDKAGIDLPGPFGDVARETPDPEATEFSVKTGETPETQSNAAPDSAVVSEAPAAEFPDGGFPADEGGSGSIPEEIPPCEKETSLPVQEAEPPPMQSGRAWRVIWEGKGCMLGISFGPHYQITDQSIRIADARNGVAEYPLSKIAMLKVKQNWLGRLCGCGDLVATVRGTAGETSLSLKAIPHPAKVLRIIADLIGSSYNIKYG